VPASASLSLAAVVDHVGGMEGADPVVLAPDLRDVLGSVVDPRKRRGVRHSLGVVLTVVVCAVVAGARSFVAIAEWVADLPDELAQTLDTDRRRPSESAIRRLLGKLDADRFDNAMGGFVQRLCAQVAPVGRRRVLAVDGKTVRGSRHTRSDERRLAGAHRLGEVTARGVVHGLAVPDHCGPHRARRVGAQGVAEACGVPEYSHMPLTSGDRRSPVVRHDHRRDTAAVVLWSSSR
jgi:DDE_Tnp_1-associated